jgi:hypothetical protein
MNRIEFVKKIIRYLLFGLLGGIAFLTGSRIAAGSDCSSCPGKGICVGESDCSTFLSDKYGRAEK